MRDRLSLLPSGLMLFVFLLLTSCAPSATTGPEKPSPSPQPSIREQPAARPPTGPPSLEAAREGKPPVTPAASPLKEIYFDFDRADLRTEARATLKANAGWLKANPSAPVEIEGHCDERGTTEYNLALGAKRAQAAKDYLITLGIAGARLSTISYGKELPVCKEHNEECWQKNRRARFVVRTARPPS